MYHFIVNPASRSGRGALVWHQSIEPALQAVGIEYKAHFSKRLGHIAKLTEELIATEPNTLYLIIVGGDGSFNEALQGINDFSKVVMGFIPTGSGNDLAKALHISQNPQEALDQIFGSEPKLLDMGLLTWDGQHSRKFAISCGMGFDAAICEEVGRSPLKVRLNKWKLGKLTYLLIALKQLFTVKRYPCTVSFSDGSSFADDKFLFLTGMIHPFEGGGFCFCPHADAHDGMIESCFAGAVPKLLSPIALLFALFGKHTAFRHIRTDRALSLKVSSAVPLWVHTDGEVTMQAHEIAVSCLKQKLQILY